MDNRIILLLAAAAGIGTLYFLSKRGKNSNGSVGGHSTGDYNVPGVSAATASAAPMTLIKTSAIKGGFKPMTGSDLIRNRILRPIV